MPLCVDELYYVFVCVRVYVCMYVCICVANLIARSPIAEVALLSMFHEIGKFHHVDNLFELVVEEHFPYSCDSHVAYLVCKCFLLLKI
jgi:hypothetical protein